MTLAPSGAWQRSSPSMDSVPASSVTLTLCSSRPGASRSAPYASVVSHTFIGNVSLPVLPPFVALAM